MSRRAEHSYDMATAVPSVGHAVRRAVMPFLLLSLVALVVLITGTWYVAGRIAHNRALEDASEQAGDIANRLVAPLVNESVREGDPGATAALDSILASRMRDGSLRHVKLWDRDGRIIWADEPVLIGRRFELEEDVVALFGSQETAAHLTDVSADENFRERELGETELVEVYAGAADSDGESFVFEAYLTTDQMEQDAAAIARSFIPLVVGALILLLAVILPLAVSLTRRAVRAEHDRLALTQHALLASDRERRRIAQDLHDGVIQDLAGLGYALPTASRQLQAGGDLERAREAIDRAVDLVQHDISQLRAMMTDIYPPDLRGRGLRDAVTQLVQTEALAAELQSSVAIDPQLDLATDASQLAYRVVREAVRNVVKHADATRVRVEVGEHDGHALVRISDDGRGPGPEPGRSPDGHLGLTLLKDTVNDFGGEFAVQELPEGGTSVVARFPVTLLSSPTQ